MKATKRQLAGILAQAKLDRMTSEQLQEFYYVTVREQYLHGTSDRELRDTAVQLGLMQDNDPLIIDGYRHDEEHSAGQPEER